MRIAIIGLLLAAITAQQAKPSKEPEFKKAISVTWEKLATWCAEKKLRPEARAAADEALALDAGNAKAKSARDAAAGDNEASDADKKEYTTKLASTRKQASGLWKQLAVQPHPDKDDAIYDGYWGKALELDPKGTQPLYDAEWRTAIQKSKWMRAAQLIAQEDTILGADAGRTKALRDVEVKVSDTNPLVKKASTHELRYFFSLPKGWTPAKKWPVLVVVEGAGCGFEGQCRNFMGQRSDLPLIIIAPCTFGNTNALSKDKYPWYPQSLLDEVNKSGRIPWDDAGLMVALDDLKRDYAAEDKFFITGFSGGGNLTWHNVFTRPARLLGAFPACANFSSRPQAAPEGGRDVPVRAFQGDKDEYLDALNQQWNGAEKLLKDWGYTNYSRKMLPGVTHAPCQVETIAGIKEILKIK